MKRKSLRVALLAILSLILLPALIQTGHNLLSASHPDTVPASPVAGDLLRANTSNVWERLPVGSSGRYLRVPLPGSSQVPTWKDRISPATLVIATTNPAHPSRVTEADIVCDGTNDTWKIQGALNTVGAGKGGRLVFLEGTYNVNVTDTIHLNGEHGQQPGLHHDNIVLEGQAAPCQFDEAGSWISPQTPGGTIFQMSASRTMFQFWKVHTIELRNIQFRNPPSAPGSQSFPGFKALHFIESQNVGIYNCHFNNCSPAIYNQGGWEFQTAHSVFDHCGSGATESQAAVVARSDVSTRPNIANGNCVGWRFIGCLWSMRPGIGFYSSAVAGGPPNDSIEMTNCKFEGWYGPEASPPKDWAYPCVVGAIARGRFIGNFFFRSLKEGTPPPFPGAGSLVYLTAGSSLNIFAGNLFYEYSGYAIDVTGGNHNQIVNNTFQLPDHGGALPDPTHHVRLAGAAWNNGISGSIVNSANNIPLLDYGDAEAGEHGNSVVHHTLEGYEFSRNGNPVLKIGDDGVLDLSGPVSPSAGPVSGYLNVRIGGAEYRLALRAP